MENKERETSKWNSVAHCRCANDQVSCSLAACSSFFFFVFFLPVGLFLIVSPSSLFFLSSLLPPFHFIRRRVGEAEHSVGRCIVYIRIEYLGEYTHLIQVSVRCLLLLLFVGRTTPGHTNTNTWTLLSHSPSAYSFAERTQTRNCYNRLSLDLASALKSVLYVVSVDTVAFSSVRSSFVGGTKISKGRKIKN